MHSDWETSFFRGVALEAWRRAVNLFLDTKAEADFLEKSLNLQGKSKIADIACGSGRHATELARRGYRVTGVDISKESIAEARAHSEVPVEWILGDMRRIKWRAEFEGAYCFGNSFGYLDRDEAPAFLASLAGALKPGARFVLDTGMAAESILPSLLKTRWMRLGDLLMLSENKYDPTESRLDIEYTFVHGGGIEVRPSASYVFTTAELCRMHRDAGLEPVELLGSLAGEPFQLGSPRLLMVSERRG